MSKVVAITGAGGFIGKYLVRFFKQQGFIVYEVHRNDFFSTSTLSNKINDADYVINLAGKSVFTRWTSKNKKAILNSRISTTKKIVEVLNGKKKPVHLLNASAIGIYSYKQVHDEESKDYAGNFLTDMVLAWEQEAEKLQYDQLTIMRFSVVLGREGGAFKTLRMFNKLRIGNYFGDGKQPFPFIHIYDLACAVLYLMNHQIKGLVNISAPENITYLDFMRTIQKRYKFFLLFPVPELSVRLVLGEASQFILKTPWVLPKRLISYDFNFTYPTIDDCMKELI